MSPAHSADLEALITSHAAPPGCPDSLKHVRHHAYEYMRPGRPVVCFFDVEFKDEELVTPIPQASRAGILPVLLTSIRAFLRRTLSNLEADDPLDCIVEDSSRAGQKFSKHLKFPGVVMASPAALKILHARLCEELLAQRHPHLVVETRVGPRCIVDDAVAADWRCLRLALCSKKSDPGRVLHFESPASPPYLSSLISVPAPDATEHSFTLEPARVRGTGGHQASSLFQARSSATPDGIAELALKGMRRLFPDQAEGFRLPKAKFIMDTTRPQYTHPMEVQFYGFGNFCSIKGCPHDSASWYAALHSDGVLHFRCQSANCRKLLATSSSANPPAVIFAQLPAAFEEICALVWSPARLLASLNNCLALLTSGNSTQVLEEYWDTELQQLALHIIGRGSCQDKHANVFAFIKSSKASRCVTACLFQEDFSLKYM